MRKALSEWVCRDPYKPSEEHHHWMIFHVCDCFPWTKAIASGIGRRKCTTAILFFFFFFYLMGLVQRQQQFLSLHRNECGYMRRCLEEHWLLSSTSSCVSWTKTLKSLEGVSVEGSSLGVNPSEQPFQILYTVLLNTLSPLSIYRSGWNFLKALQQCHSVISSWQTIMPPSGTMPWSSNVEKTNSGIFTGSIFIHYLNLFIHTLFFPGVH